MSWPASHEDTVQLVLHIVKNTPAGNPYEELKDRISSSSTDWTLKSFLETRRHSLYRRQRPLSLLTTMREYCPRGKERSQLFAFLFLQPLPNELRILLMHKESTDLKSLAAKWQAGCTPTTRRSSQSMPSPSIPRSYTWRRTTGLWRCCDASPARRVMVCSMAGEPPSVVKVAGESVRPRAASQTNPSNVPRMAACLC